MTPHTRPLLFVPTEAGFARYLGEPRQFAMLEPQSECPLTETGREPGDRNAAPKLLTGVARLLRSERFSRAGPRSRGGA